MSKILTGLKLSETIKLFEDGKAEGCKCDLFPNDKFLEPNFVITGKAYLTKWSVKLKTERMNNMAKKATAKKSVKKTTKKK